MLLPGCIVNRTVGAGDGTMSTAIPPIPVLMTVMRAEIDKFMSAARERCEFDIDTRRRAMRRYHRSWPLVVYLPKSMQEVSAALHSASASGIGFLCDQGLHVDQVIYIKLFWHDDHGLRVPAIVRHATPHRDVYLIGCEYAVEDHNACQVGLDLHNWYG
jgi:hypothetical protein